MVAISAKKASFWGALALAVSLGTPHVSAEESGASSSEAAQRAAFRRKAFDPKANPIDCDKVRQKVMTGLDKLRHESKDVDRDCRANIPAEANRSIVTANGRGACQLTYDAIRRVSESVEKKVAGACQRINEAKALGQKCADGQAKCLEGPRKKYAEAAKALEETEQELARGERAMEERRADNRKVAERYAEHIGEMAALLRNRKPGEDPLENYDTKVFGFKDHDALLAYYRWKEDPEVLRQGSLAYREAFESSVTSPMPGVIGPQMDEQRRAFDTGTRAIQVTREMRSGLSGFREALVQNTVEIGRSGESLGSISSGSVSTASISAGTVFAGPAATAPSAGPFGQSGATGASRKTGGAPGRRPAEGGIRGALRDASPPPHGLTPFPPLSTGPEARAYASARRDRARPEITLSSAGEREGREEKSRQERGAEVSELLSAFTPIGDTLPRLATAEAGPAPGKVLAATEGPPSPMEEKSSSHNIASLYNPSFSVIPDSTGSPTEGVLALSQPAPVKDLSTPNREKGKEARPASFLARGSDLAKSLRARLREQLHARETSGDDVRASRAVDELVMDALAGTAARQEDAGSPDQAGPLTRESEPLFRRVHLAHERFQLRTFPRQAGL